MIIKHKSELLLIIIVIPILGYVGWQAYNTWFASPDNDIAILEQPVPETEIVPTEKSAPIGEHKKTPTIEPEEKPSFITETKTIEQKNIEKEKPVTKETIPPIETKGTLDFTGYTERDPLKPSLPEEEKNIEQPEEKTIQPVDHPTEKPTEEIIEQPKEIIPPTFTITGIVWGNVESRVIIDNEVHKIGDIVKGATILNIAENGIQIMYEEKEFWVQKQ